VCKRLAQEGLATRRDDGRYEFAGKVGKKPLKAARAR
jgi:hypothetical protein